MPATAQEEEQTVRDVGRGRVTEPPPPVDDRPNALEAEELQRKPGEIVGDDPQGRTVVMGMYLQEDPDTEAPVIVEVAPATPAFDAGLRAGDELVSFDGFEADSYRKWIDGIRKLARDAPEGRSMPLQVVREGELLDLRLRRPESTPVAPRPRTTPAPQYAPEMPDVQLQVDQQWPQPTQPVRSGNALLGAPFFGQPFHDVIGTNGQRAIAELFLLTAHHQHHDLHHQGQFGIEAQQPNQTPAPGTPPQQPQPSPDDFQRPTAVPLETPGQATPVEPGLEDLPQFQQPRPAHGRGARIGLAGFRDQQTGMVVMLDAGGLPPGNYLVGIDDISVIMQSMHGRGMDRQPIPRGPDVPEPQLPTQPGVSPPVDEQPIDRPEIVPRTNDVTPPAGLQPDAPGAGQGAEQLPAAQPGAGAQGAVQPQAAQPAVGQPGEIAAQQPGAAQPQATEQPAAPGVAPHTFPAQQQPQQLDPTDDDLLLDEREGVRRERRFRTGLPPTHPGAPFHHPAASVGPSIPIGMLIVDETGTGTLQEVVEGVQVQQVIGQAIAIYTQAAEPALPDQVTPPRPGDDPTLDRPVPPPGAVNPQPGGQVLPGQERPIARPDAAQLGQLGGGHTPIAAGAIRVITDREPLRREAARLPADEDRTDLPQRPQPLPPQGDPR